MAERFSGAIAAKTPTSLRHYGPDITAGLVNGILIIIFQSAYAALIFAGPLSQFLSEGIGIMLFGATAMGLFMAVSSSFRGTVTAPQDAPSAIMAVIAGTIAVSMSAKIGTPTMLVTVVAAIALTSFITGLFLLVLGWFRLGNLIRFIPYPVVGGFLAGTGWVLVKGAVGIMSQVSLSLHNFPQLWSPDVFWKWFSGLIFAIVLFFSQRKFKHFLVMPALILLGIIIFYAALVSTHTPILAASHNGWLLARLSEGIFWKPILYESFPKVHWSTILHQAGNLGTITVISVISLLLNASGLELIARQEIDLNRELRATGAANIISGLGGSSVGYMSLSLTALGYRIGSRSRISALISASLCGFTLLSGATISTYFPKPLLGGLLIFLGLSFLVEWLYHAWFKLPKAEYFLVVLILITIAMFGFVEGMLLGMLISVLLFAINYGRVEVVKHVLTGTTCHSNVDRAAPYQRYLQQNGDQLYILELQGYIFFGTANTIFEKVRQRIHHPGQHAVRFLVLDFRLVSGVDSSALYSFEKMKLLAENQNISLVFTGLAPQLQHQFLLGGVTGDSRHPIRLFPDLDHGVEWIENEILKNFPARGEISFSGEDDATFLAKVLSFLNPEQGEIETQTQIGEVLINFFEPRRFQAGEYLIRQGNPPVGIFLLKSGKVTAQLEEEGEKVIRLRTMSIGTVIGELGVYLNLPATASVVANEPCTALFLSPEKLRQMEETDPAAASIFHQFIIRILGERLSNSNRALKALMG